MSKESLGGKMMHRFRLKRSARTSANIFYMGDEFLLDESWNPGSSNGKYISDDNRLLITDKDKMEPVDDSIANLFL